MTVVEQRVLGAAAPERKGAPSPKGTPRGPRALTKRELRAALDFRRARAMLLLSGVIFIGGIFIIGFGQNRLATQQIELDNLQQQLNSATQHNADLLLTRAQLEAPARILQLAERRLGMVTPRSVVYLTPAATGPTVGSSGKEPLGVKH